MNNDAEQRRFREDDERTTLERAGMLGLTYVDSRPYEEKAPLIQNILTPQEMYAAKLIPFREDLSNGMLVFAITIQTPQPVLRQLRERFNGRNLQFVMISNSGYRTFMKRYDPPKEVHYENVTIASEGDSATLAQVSQTLESVRSEDILDYLINQAERLKASDIHLETSNEGVRVRFRVDGALHVVANIGMDKYRTLQGAIASKANISTDAKDAQTGHLMQQVTLSDGSVKTLNMRIETVPTVHGQDAVLRLFDIDESMLDLDRLHLSDLERKNIDEMIAHPHGLVLVVGPTGSGKSTTLYSIIKALNDPQRKILTLEDPVEFAIDGISQIPVATRQGDSFADKLRAVLRLDPDVIMVGEIRDVDTARTAIQASITGHLVLSTFHATDAASAMSRMIDMIGPNPIFASAIKMIMGQRLVRRLDDKLKQPYQADESTAQYIRSVLQELPEGFERPNLDTITLYKPGKSQENPFGYDGRIVIMEQLLINDSIQALVRQDAQHIDSDLIAKTARQNEMLTMQQDGILKALRGETTIEEVNRVI
jgi:type IV pilus assembly protein PilB